MPPKSSPLSKDEPGIDRKLYDSINSFGRETRAFSIELLDYLSRTLKENFVKFEYVKKVFVLVLYRQRGKNAKRFIHSGMAALSAVGMMIAPIIAEEFPGTNVNPWDIPSASSVLSASTFEGEVATDISSKPRDKIVEYAVQEGDTLGSIAEKFGISEDTIRWQNDLTKDRIKVGQMLEILPVAGISHKVRKGDTVYSISKKYDADPQPIVNFPFNTFVNDETFELAIGQLLIVPEGVRPAETTSPRIRQLTPDAGTVVASGTFVWPASGTISQNFVWYHKGIDIANRSTPSVLAADSGTVVTAGWSSYGYGNHIIVDHGNGYKTLYGHLSKIFVVGGQTVARSNAIGQMGSTGRSTGTHLHFEVIKNGVYLNPISILR